MAREKIDYAGQRLGTCVVLGKIPRTSDHYDQFWLLRCDCGNDCRKSSYQLKKFGPTTRCRACFAQAVSEARRVHGETDGYLWRAWENMNRRCYDPSYKGSKNYMGRSIQVHEPWRKDYPAFATWIRANIGERPSAKYSLDRRDNEGHYVPGNLRWATAREQQLNRRPWKWGENTPKKRQLRALANTAAIRARQGLPPLDPLI